MNSIPSILLFLFYRSLFLIVLIVFSISLGVLPSLEREECKKLIEGYGGRVTTAVSGKTDYLIIGRDVGKTKTDKAAKLRVKTISEDDLLNMIRTRPGNENVPKQKSKTKIKKMPDVNTMVPVSSLKMDNTKEIEDDMLCKRTNEPFNQS